MKNIPMTLTWLRVYLIPLFLICFLIPNGLIGGDLYLQYRDSIACIIFVIASVTDYFDGYLARKWNQTSAFGAFLDPVADKLMVCVALLILLNLGRVNVVIVFVIIAREITVSALREWMATRNARDVVAVNSIGKWKTATQMMAIPMLLLDSFGYYWVHYTGHVLLICATILTIISMWVYLKSAWPIMRTE
ncbi:CDP-diacylglycerol--glycerol-3-phosphate 3-phosphatidyltransferase [Taylorella equigenitalis]|uniref:CDP-diacylglycerol--glycerol-3-phosphate 3-phosphatidyltransferase n=1 Tax=Taylorella equigenitalis 14/56 TaxID=1091497 RepID=I7IIS5_9BURK|nr:CDP-diacylglycerol--glycerol-3-phosphate 3-phosphatidyltransferase [Taylorella equigenitalis]WDU45747.1 CDP-diacylglycerol--glycerol-3-phosphate 3-phosphatidyltransferase [Taylorella equigenitalis]WDU47274.1 CDP-diacylglycerol--glycerol-3-phosphate 3-phosphatidyltransferase [Taylorella equigenitalis]CCG17717.1 CDP-diacylglycerol--glycerol-3-phosphate-3-phos phatidyltransferase [Taylorella equigenitalis 14/56]